MIGLASLIGGAVQTVGTIFTKWQERKNIEAQGRVDVAKAKVEGQVKKAQTETEGEIEYDTEAQRGMRYTWKDEWLTLVLSGVFIAAFLPWTQPYVKEGFAFLKTNTPEWYTYCFIGMVISVFGLQRVWHMWKNGGK